MTMAVMARVGAHSRRRQRASGHDRVSWLCTTLAGAVVLVGGWIHRWVADDAFIDFRVVSNILHAHGPVFNPGERVEVYTDPLWVFLLTVITGIFRFISVEWCAVVLGLAFTVGGVTLGGRASAKMGSLTGASATIPVGLIAASTVDVLWDFSTSGLETGLIFGWEGLTWWLLVRAHTRQTGFSLVAFVAGLGPLIRPDLGLMSLCFIGVLAVLIAKDNSKHLEGARLRSWVVPIASALTVPALYQVWRMAYFGLIVPNTALAKSSTQADWAQGAVYLRDFINPYWLWVPITVGCAALR
jgi:arabinofuranosyltransferase